jgi:hypothetical protein
MIQRIVRKALWGLFFFAFFEKFFVPILTSGGLAAVSSSAFAALYSAFGKYDVVHIHAEGPAFFAWLPKMFGKRVVVTVHGIDWQREKWQSGLGSKFIHQGEKNAAKYADEVIVLSKGVQDYFKETYGRETHFIPNGVNRPEVELIPIRNLVSNQEYQRPLSENHIRKALEEFDVYQINPVKVSRRDGINYVFDGQHTIEIIASESGSRDTPVWCMIYDDLKYKEEAHIFADQQKHVKALSSFETFKAHIEADDPKQKMIEAIVQSYGLAITSTKAKNGISAVSTLERIYDKYGQAVLDRTLRLAAATWEGENNSFSGNILMGIARIVVAYGDTVRDDVFKDHVE